MPTGGLTGTSEGGLCGDGDWLAVSERIWNT